MEEIQELLLDNQFRKYRRAELQAAVEYVKETIFRDDLNSAELKGALEIIRKIIKLPADKFSLSEVTKEKVDETIREDFEWLNTQIVRQSIE